MLLATILLCSVLPELGTADTVGYTSTDGIAVPVNAVPTVVRDPAHGIHIGWRMMTAGADTATRAWYNFVDLAGNHDPTGVEMLPWPPYPSSSLLVGIGTTPSGCAVGVTYWSYGGMPGISVARDVAPNAGIFEYADAPRGTWPVMAVGPDGAIHVAYWKFPPTDTLFYTRCDTWPNWTSPVPVLAADWLPRQNLVASRGSGRLALLWFGADTVTVRLSSDAGSTWGQPVSMTVPAFSPGSESTAILRSVSGLFDLQDSLHLVVAVVPLVRDTLRNGTAEIWHWTPGNSPAWSRVRHASPAALAAPLESGDDIAVRPSIGIGMELPSRLVSVWQEFTPSNPESLTNCLRSAVWLAGSDDGGRHWSTPVPTTDTTAEYACCMPFVAETVDDSIHICYVADSVAGHDTGPCTRNAVVVQSIPTSALGIETPARPRTQSPTSARGPTIITSAAKLQSAILNRQSNCALFDATGRRARPLHSGSRDVAALAPGVYFVWTAEQAAKVVIQP
jgi:hypothetical protein